MHLPRDVRTASPLTSMESPSLEASFGCSRCWPADAAAARDAIRALPVDRELVDESHYRVIVRRCGSCGQQFLSVFTELIDWADGDDPHSSTVIPLRYAEAVALRGVNSPPTPEQINRVGPQRRSLRYDAPKNAAARTSWGLGIRVGPHD